MPLDAICLSGVVRELRETALGLRIEKVQQPARDQVVLALRGNQKLLLCAGASQAIFISPMSSGRIPPRRPCSVCCCASTYRADG